MKSIAILSLICYTVYLLIPPSTGCWFITTVLDDGNDTRSAAEERAVDWSRYNLAQQAFITCNDDGEEGLAWDEISACEEQFCGLLSVECPTEDDFEAFDINEDGILTWNEFMEVNLAMSGSARSAIEGLFRKEL